MISGVSKRGPWCFRTIVESEGWFHMYLCPVRNKFSGHLRARHRRGLAVAASGDKPFAVMHEPNLGHELPVAGDTAEAFPTEEVKQP